MLDVKKSCSKRMGGGTPAVQQHMLAATGYVASVWAPHACSATTHMLAATGYVASVWAGHACGATLHL